MTVPKRSDKKDAPKKPRTPEPEKTDMPKDPDYRPEEKDRRGPMK